MRLSIKDLQVKLDISLGAHSIKYAKTLNFTRCKQTAHSNLRSMDRPKEIWLRMNVYKTSMQNSIHQFTIRNTIPHYSPLI